MFVSRNALEGSVEQRVADLAALVAQSRRRNAAWGITGAIALHRGRFAQVIEGSEAAVAAIFGRIRRDQRHRGVTVLRRGPAADRRFPGHAMVLVGHTREGHARLDGVMMQDAETFDGMDPEVLTETLRSLAQTEISGAAALTTRTGGTEEETFTAGGMPEEAPATGATPVELDAVDEIFLVAVIAADRTILRENANFRALFGYEAGELPGQPYGTLIHAADAGRLDGLWARLRRGRSVTVDWRGLRRDGAELWLKSTYRPRLDPAGRLRDIVEIATDITAQQRERAEERGQVRSINQSQAVIHFDLDGRILSANPLFLAAMGYTAEEIVGQHYRIFVEPAYAESAEYSAFWSSLATGRHASAEFKRLGKGGRAVWLQATYSPIIDMGGKPFKIVKYATLVTEQKLRQADYEWQIAAIYKSHAVITFDMNGIILEANAAFLEAMGYRLDEIVGHHHRLFVEAAYAHGADYAAFWRALARGTHQAGQYRRTGKGGREIWLQATYNPIFDMDGRPIKVVGFATVVTEEKLRQAEHQGQIAAIHKAQSVVTLALDGTILDSNDNFLARTGYRLADVVGRHHRMFVEPEEAASAAYAAFWAQLAAGLHQSGEYKRIGREGREIWLQATYNPICDLSGRPFRVVKYATDITREKLRQADVNGQIAAIGKSQGVITFSMDGLITDINDNFLKVLGYAREAVIGRHHEFLVEPAYAATEEYAQFWETLRSGTFLAGRYKRVGADGQDIWIQATYNPILDLNGRPFKVVKFASDVTADVALAEAYEDAKQQAQHDAATALPNRVRLASYLATALARPGGRVVVLYLDLDRFKPINDTFGHHVGDQVLGETADRLRRSLVNDQLAARIGGDEFVIVAPDLADEEIERFCQRLLDVVALPIRHAGGELNVGVSIGIAVSPADGLTPDALLRSADEALYRSKQSGRGLYSFYTAATNDRILARRTRIDDLRRGIAAEEFFLEYQPRCATRTHAIQSVEALVRWAHPEHGQISPGDFIPLAEASGLIVELGQWVLRTACRAAAAWGGIGVSVNVSPAQFRNGDLVAMVTAALAESGLDPRRLEIEITEGVLLENADLARSALESLKRLGIRLAMDDFGTGYSSLSSLRSFPFDVIKIDRQFVADMEDRDGGRDVVRAILGLGRALNLSVTAEGVETVNQLKMLADDACSEVQGYLLAKPMTAASISALLQDGGITAVPGLDRADGITAALQEDAA
ncbi:PAS domain-containing protein [Methylobacterium soli]|uniref:PAS domain-containing protein n=1 Tax=Methylobacterium soli TaxID=553447 RepID=UPI001FD2F82A|nr:PAS domain-containing protein [Methylobacterium soli]